MATKNNETSNIYKFLFGGLAGMGATLFVQPIDLIKNRMQLSGEMGSAKAHKSTFQAISNIIRKEGIFNLYKGLSAGLLRQATYTTSRLGMYSYLFEKFTKKDDTPGFITKLILGCTAGGFGAIIGTPAEVALIRMTSDGRLPVEQRRNYKNAIEALIRISREEGVFALWRGCVPTIMRAMVLNAAQLASYSQIKELLLKSKPDFFETKSVKTHLVASTFSGFISTCVSMPVDITKTRIQTMKYINGKPEYKGALDVLTKVIRYEGFFSLWKGFLPYFFRLGPHTVLTFIFIEQLNNFFLKGKGL
eukprot:TRINITY_DN15771_c0_g1_i1.p1 TRINITY_DN15771_c0_g1~~TRINITY_DN15771_c0_g1_i1.p1  ORF type:complete len:305 (-),score=96.17 TRINITY_DN15771_c0_g1_i1:77-991(-)